MTVKLFFLFAKFPDSNFMAGKTTKLEDMRKYLLIIGVIISISIQSFASKSAIYMDLAKRGRSDKCTTVRRSPMQCPIDVFYDAVDNSAISIISILDGNTKVMDSIVTGESNISIDVANFEKGIYVVVYTVDGMVVDQKKIDIR